MVSSMIEKNMPAEHPETDDVSGFSGRNERISNGRSDECRMIRETFTLPPNKARAMADEWVKQFPSAIYWSKIENWQRLPNNLINFTLVRLPAID